MNDFDDYMRRRQGVQYTDMARELGVNVQSVQRRAAAHGWRRRPGPACVTTHAPCAGCGRKLVPMEDLVNWLCPTCRAPSPAAAPDPNRALYRRELARVRKKRKRLGERAWNDRYARPQWGLGGGKFLGGA